MIPRLRSKEFTSQTLTRRQELILQDWLGMRALWLPSLDSGPSSVVDQLRDLGK